MKKVLFVLLIIFVCVSCSKEDARMVPADGQYVANLGVENETTFAVVLNDGICGDIIMYFSGKRFDYQTDGINTKGRFPNYEYNIETDRVELNMQAHFNNPNIFFATFCGSGYTEEWTADDIPPIISCWAIEVPAPVEFRLDNTALDADGDGVLDRWYKMKEPENP